MRWQGTFTKMLIFAGLPICIGLVIALAVLNSSIEAAQHKNIESILMGARDTANKTVMLNSQGDADLASYIHPSAEPGTTVQIILSRKVSGYQLPCLGFWWMGGMESRPADTFGLVVFGGELHSSGFPAQVRVSPSEPYMAYLYDFRYGATSASGSAEWPSLRAAFGGPGWPEDCPMYVSPDGQPSLAELEHGLSAPVRRQVSPQDLNVSQESGGWKITVARVYAEGNVISLDYTVTGPYSRHKVDQPMLSIEGKDLLSNSTGRYDEVLGPATWSVSAFGLPVTTQPREITVHFVIPAIHVRPPIYPCEEPGTPPAENPPPTTSTPAPANTLPGGNVATPIPDVKTVGPFIFDLKVVVQPKPTERPVPSPIPTSTGLRVPLPQPTRQP